MYTFHQLPALKILAPLLLGIVCGVNCLLTFQQAILLGLFILIVAVLVRKTSLYLLLFFSFLLGFSCAINWEKKQTLPYKTLCSLPVRVHEIIKQTPQQVHFTFLLKGNEVLVYHPKKYDDEVFLPDDSLFLAHVILNELDTSAQNEFATYHQYLQSKNIHALVFCKAKNLQGHQQSSSWRAQIYLLRHQLVTKIKESSAFKLAEESIFLALLLGEKSYLDKELKNAYRVSGVIHVLAISGLHVGMVYLFLQVLFRFLPFSSPTTRFFVVFLGLSFYAALAGFSPSVCRAALMCVLMQLGRLLQEKTSSLNVVFVSAIFLLVIEPEFLFDIGFQLSYAAVLGIIYFLPLYQKHQYRFQQRISGKIFSFSQDLIYLSLAASLGTFPLLAYHFGEIYYASIVSSILVVPIITLVVILGLSALMFLPFDSLFYYSLKIVDFVLFSCNHLIFKFNELVKMHWVGNLNWLEVILIYLLILSLSTSYKNFLPFLMRNFLIITVLLFTKLFI